jgi:hypothetical protein
VLDADLDPAVQEELLTELGVAVELRALQSEAEAKAAKADQDAERELMRIELETAAALAIGAATIGPAPRPAWLVAPLAAAAGLAMALATWRDDLRTSRLDELRRVVAALPPGPVLSEDPLVPLLAGARPVVLDPWMLRVSVARDPGIAAGLAAELAGGRYAAVVLFQDLDAPGADAWYANRNLGLPLVAAIRSDYRAARAIGRYHVYLPRAERELAREPRVSAAAGASGVVTGRAAR